MSTCSRGSSSVAAVDVHVLAAPAVLLALVMTGASPPPEGVYSGTLYKLSDLSYRPSATLAVDAKEGTMTFVGRTAAKRDSSRFPGTTQCSLRLEFERRGAGWRYFRQFGPVHRLTVDYVENAPCDVAPDSMELRLRTIPGASLKTELARASKSPAAFRPVYRAILVR